MVVDIVFGFLTLAVDIDGRNCVALWGGEGVMCGEGEKKENIMRYNRAIYEKSRGARTQRRVC